MVAIGGAAANYANPLGRASITKPPTREMLSRASLIKVSIMNADDGGGVGVGQYDDDDGCSVCHDDDDDDDSC